MPAMKSRAGSQSRNPPIGLGRRIALVLSARSIGCCALVIERQSGQSYEKWQRVHKVRLLRYPESGWTDERIRLRQQYPCRTNDLLVRQCVAVHVRPMWLHRRVGRIRSRPAEIAIEICTASVARMAHASHAPQYEDGKSSAPVGHYSGGRWNIISACRVAADTGLCTFERQNNL